jgi:outer membrane immunogenic protein
MSGWRSPAVIAFRGPTRRFSKLRRFGVKKLTSAGRRGLLFHSLRKISLFASLIASVISLSQKEAAAQAPTLVFGSNAANASSWVAGAHAGYNWQQGAMLYGFETDFQATHLNSSMTGGLTNISPVPGDFAATVASIDWYGTFRGRLGVTTGQWLFYGTAGAAYGNVDLSSSFRTFGLLTSSQTTEPKIGWVAGVGVEYLLQPNVMLSLGYQYVDLGRISIASSTTGFGGALVIGQAASVHAQFQTVMLGLSWRFAPAGSGSPWAGGYAGGQAGGAWDNPANAMYTSTFFPGNISDVRLKRDVTLLTRRSDGLGIYRYRYLWSDALYVGVMAQEVALLRPDAVFRDPLFGYLSVDYSRLGLRLMMLADRETSLPL